FDASGTHSEMGAHFRKGQCAETRRRFCYRAAGDPYASARPPSAAQRSHRPRSTIRRLNERFAATRGQHLIGMPLQIIDEMESWFLNNAGDGVLGPALPRSGGRFGCAAVTQPLRFTSGTHALTALKHAASPFATIPGYSRQKYPLFTVPSEIGRVGIRQSCTQALDGSRIRLPAAQSLVRQKLLQVSPRMHGLSSLPQLPLAPCLWRSVLRPVPRLRPPCVSQCYGALSSWPQ